MRIIKIIVGTYVGSYLGFLFGEHVIVKIAGQNLDLWAVLETGTREIPPVLLGLLLSGIVGTVAGASFVRKGKIRALVGCGGSFIGLIVATAGIYHDSTLYNIFYVVYPLFAVAGWELGMYIFRRWLRTVEPEP